MCVPFLEIYREIWRNIERQRCRENIEKDRETDRQWFIHYTHFILKWIISTKYTIFLDYNQNELQLGTYKLKKYKLIAYNKVLIGLYTIQFEFIPSDI